MSWKKKEKDLTLDEAVELATKELAPYWINSKPQIIGIRSPEKVMILPLDSDFSKKAWLIFCVNVTDFNFDPLLLYAKEWNRRYQNHHLKTMVILTPQYEYIKNPEFIRKLKEKRQLDFPLTIDIQDNLFAAFSVTQSLKILLQQGTKRYFEREQCDWPKTTEIELQRFLRSTDPGLSLLPLFRPNPTIHSDPIRLEFGSNPKNGIRVEFKNGHFPNDSGDEKKGQFHYVKQNIELGEFFIQGQWSQNHERILTSDPQAQISFRVASTDIALIARANHTLKTVASDVFSTVTVEVNNDLLHEGILGQQLILDETGQANLHVDQPSFYHILAHLPSESNEITLRFTNAARVPIELYGLRFCNT